MLSNVGSGGGAAAPAAAGGAAGGGAAEEAAKEEEKEEGTFPQLLGRCDGRGELVTDFALQRRRSRTRTWVSAFSTKLLSSSFPFLLCPVRL